MTLTKLISLYFASIYLLLAILTQLNLQIHYIDVDDDLLNAKDKEEIHTKPPKGFPFPSETRAVFGLKQSSLEWYNNINSYFIYCFSLINLYTDKN